MNVSSRQKGAEARCAGHRSEVNGVLLIRTLYGMRNEYLYLSKWFEGLLMNVSPRQKEAESYNAGYTGVNSTAESKPDVILKKALLFWLQISLKT